MNGDELVRIMSEFNIKVGPATKHNWGKMQSLSKTVLRNAFSIFERQKLYSCIAPISEFRELHIHHGKSSDTFAARINNKGVAERLRSCVGIYAFFDPSGRVIYIGKTKNNLFLEMQQRYWNKEVSVRLINNGTAKSADIKIYHVAAYFSAYEVDVHLIDNIEALLTRIIINSASNIRVEHFHETARKKHADI